jgi:hypothetical protein
MNERQEPKSVLRSSHLKNSSSQASKANRISLASHISNTTLLLSGPIIPSKTTPLKKNPQPHESLSSHRHIRNIQPTSSCASRMRIRNHPHNEIQILILIPIPAQALHSKTGIPSSPPYREMSLYYRRQEYFYHLSCLTASR